MKKRYRVTVLRHFTEVASGIIAVDEDKLEESMIGFSTTNSDELMLELEHALNAELPAFRYHIECVPDEG